MRIPPRKRKRPRIENKLTQLMFDCLMGKVSIDSDIDFPELRRRLVVKAIAKQGGWSNLLADELDEVLYSLFRNWINEHSWQLSEAILIADGWWTSGDDWAERPAAPELIEAYLSSTVPEGAVQSLV